jgi:hypothetical protein
MAFADEYLAKYGPGKSFITAIPENELKSIVVIPAFNESGLLECLDSLFQCTQVESPVEIITVINWPYGSDEQTVNNNLEIRDKAIDWSSRHNSKNKKFHFITRPGEDRKNTGVGFARKTGMDEAILRFNDLNQPRGVIFSLDADCQVEKSYFTEVLNFLDQNHQTPGCNIYFEHPLEGDYEKAVYSGIARYELHLRYYIQSLRYAGHPNAFHTVGSSFAVRSDNYCRQGGMNKRQAGEDFYFLQKFFDLGTYSECNSTCVYPSPRPSSRVAFGTGPSISDYLENKSSLLSFNPQLFEILKVFLDQIPALYKQSASGNYSFLESIHPLLREFLQVNDISTKLNEIYQNSSTPHAFQKRFFRWFNMFRVLKFLNYSKKNFPDVEVTEAAWELLRKNRNFKGKTPVINELLGYYRDIDQGVATILPPQQ